MVKAYIIAIAIVGALFVLSAVKSRIQGRSFKR